jgi:hypothetical protein
VQYYYHFSICNMPHHNHSNEMSTIKHCESPYQLLHCSWPLKFFERREYFNRRAENQTYVEWLRVALFESASDCGEEVEDETDDGEELHEEKKITDQSEDEKEGYEENLRSWLKEGYNFQSDGKDEYEGSCRVMPEADDPEPYPEKSIARILMNGMTGDDEILPYRDQVDVVAGFYEQGYHAGSQVKEEKAVALLDDMSHRSGSLTTKSYRRIPRGPLTSMQLRTELGKAVMQSNHFAGQ